MCDIQLPPKKVDLLKDFKFFLFKLADRCVSFFGFKKNKNPLSRIKVDINGFIITYNN